MKNHPVSQTGFILICALLIASLSGLTAGAENNAANHADNCVENLEGLKINADMHSQMVKFGGLEGIVGQWKMNGLMGTLTKTKVEFKVDAGQFWVGINKDPVKQVWLCLGDKAEELKVKVLKPKYPKNGTIILKPGSVDQVHIAANSSGWRFMKFKKIASKGNSKAAAFIASEE